MMAIKGSFASAGHDPEVIAPLRVLRQTHGQHTVQPMPSLRWMVENPQDLICQKQGVG